MKPPSRCLKRLKTDGSENMRKGVSFVLIAIFIVSLCGCAQTPNSSVQISFTKNDSVETSSDKENQPSDKATFFDFSGLSKMDIISKLAEIMQYSLFIDSVKYPFDPFASGVNYALTGESIREVSAIELRGLPILINKMVELETSTVNVFESPDIATGLRLAREYLFTIPCILRIDYQFLIKLIDYKILPRENIYILLTKAETTLEQVWKSNMSAEQKLHAYRKFGMLSVPFVKKEIENGNTELKDFFVLIGAHLSTKDYLLLVDRNQHASPNVSAEEYDAALINSAKDFDYKVWLSENEEDLNNLFKYLDAYCAEYETAQAE